MHTSWSTLSQRIHPPPPAADSLVPQKISRKMALEMCKRDVDTQSTDELDNPDAWYIHSMFEPLQDGCKNLHKNSIVAIRGEEKDNSTNYWFARVVEHEDNSNFVRVQWFDRVRRFK